MIEGVGQYYERAGRLLARIRRNPNQVILPATDAVADDRVVHRTGGAEFAGDVSLRNPQGMANDRATLNSELSRICEIRKGPQFNATQIQPREMHRIRNAVGPLRGPSPPELGDLAVRPSTIPSYFEAALRRKPR